MRLTPDKISDIFIKFVEGDENAFSFFYKYYINDMYAYGRGLGADETYVMDAIQDVFIKLFYDKPNLKSAEHLKYYLLKSLKNQLYDIFKSKSFSNTDSINDDTLNFSIKTTVLDDIIEKEDRIIIEQKIEDLLSILTPLQKEAVYLRYIQSLEYAEISEIMGKPETSIRKLVSQAIIKIRKENNILPMMVFITLLSSKFYF